MQLFQRKECNRSLSVEYTTLKGQGTKRVHSRLPCMFERMYECLESTLQWLYKKLVMVVAFGEGNVSNGQGTLVEERLSFLCMSFGNF